MGSNKNVVISFSIAILLLLSLLLLLTYNSKCSSNNSQMNYMNNSQVPSGFSGDNEKYYNFETFTSPSDGNNAPANQQVSQSRQNFQSNSVAANSNPDPNLAATGIGNYSPSNPDFNTSQILDPQQSDNYNVNDQYSSVNSIGGGDNSQAGMQSCYPRDRLTASDLLPKDAADSKWARINPSGTGDIHDQNYLTAGYHVGINTVGQSLRNANLQLRSEIPNPQKAVSPWGNSTIEPDLRQYTLEIGSSPAY
jgi:hypothetical protein